MYATSLSTSSLVEQVMFPRSFLLLFVIVCLSVSPARARTPKPSVAVDISDQLPDPDGKPADMTKPVQVYILLGQSNMVGAGKITGDKEGSLTYAVQEKNKYPYLVDDAGNWTVRKDVRYVRVMGSGTGAMRQFNNEWMTITGGKIGPEYGIGHYVGHAIDAPVMILKSCIGNRSLGWDLLPPGSERYEVEETDKKTGETKTFVYAGYKDSPAKWEKGTEPEPIGWYAGMQYDGDVANAKKVLAELDKYYPGAKEYEVAGFFFWQGDKDRYNAAHASRYEQNLVHFIKQLRKDFDAPEREVRLCHARPDREGRRRQRRADPRRPARGRRQERQVPGVQGQRRHRVHQSSQHGRRLQRPLRRQRRDLHERRRSHGQGDGSNAGRVGPVDRALCAPQRIHLTCRPA